MVILIISVELEHVALAVEFIWVVFFVIAKAIVIMLMVPRLQTTTTTTITTITTTITITIIAKDIDQCT